LFSINRKEHKERRDKFPGDARKAGLAGCLGRLNFKILFILFILSTARTHFDDRPRRNKVPSKRNLIASSGQSRQLSPKPPSLGQN
jgi:hypothetical protein